MSVFKVSSNKSSQNQYPSVRPTLDLDFANTKTLDPRITFTRASGGSYVGADGLIKLAGVNEARFDHNPLTGESLGLLVEEARTNEFTTSNPWAGGSNVTWTSSQVSPTGGTEAYSMVETTANNIHGLSILGGFAAGYNRHISVFAKSAGRRYLVFWAALGAYPGADSPECIFDLQSGTVAYLDTSGAGGIFRIASITNFGNGWYRCGIHLNPSSLANRALHMLIGNSASPQQSSYAGDGSSGISLFGLQLEAGAFPTSYIPTTGSSVTRAADVASITGTNFSSWYRQDEGTVFALHKAQPAVYGAVGRAVWQLDRPSSSGGWEHGLIYHRTSANYGVRGGDDDGSFVTVNHSDSVGSTTRATLGWSNAFRQTRMAYNGTLSSVVGKGAGTNIDRLIIGGAFAFDNFSGQVNTTIARLTYYPKRLPDAQLQALTR